MSRTPSSGRTTQQTWNLLVGEDTWAGQNAQNPRTARKVSSWIPQDSGELHREVVEPLYLSTTLSGPVVGMYQFVQNTGGGNVTRHYFAAARTNFTAGTKTCNLYTVSAGAWVQVTAVGTLGDAPMCVTQQDNFYLADGTNNWLYDGTNWVKDGLDIPFNAPAINISNGTPTVLFSGNVTAYLLNTGDTSHHGDFKLNYPFDITGKPTATGSSVMFNPPAYNGTVDPNVQPLQWATVNSSGIITGYTVPFAGATENYSMSVIFTLVIPAAGTYTIALQHDDGAFFGVGNGVSTGSAPSKVSSAAGNYNIWQTRTAVMGYPTDVGGGFNKSGNFNDTFVLNFPRADSYPVEINFRQWVNEQQLVFLVNGSTPIPGSGSNPGSINAVLGKTYWYTNADETSGRAHESSSSPIGTTTGPLVGATVKVYQQPGKFTSSTASTTVTGASSSDSPGPVAPALGSWMAGKKLWINGTAIGTIASVSGNNITLTANALATVSAGRAVIADSRATHWHVYASESDGSKIGQQLASVPVTQNLNSTPYTDNSPFLDDATNDYLPIFRPVRNDPPPPSRLLEVHKIRQWRRREAAPNFFNFTANEEVTSGNNGDPTQCVPGADASTISDLVNEVSFPDQSSRLRGLISHTDALYMFSERQCYPLYGQSVDDFAISQVVAFSLGLAGRFAAKSTPHGLAFVSYDRRVFLYPSSPYGTYLAESGSGSSALKEIGKPLRPKFLLMDPARLDEVVMGFYHFGIRDWLVVSFPDTNGTYQCYVYDFSTGGWFQIQRGFGALAVFEVSEGKLVLIGGAKDGKTYVIDDQTGTYTTTGTLPQAIFRPALIDFGDPSHPHIFRNVELEFNSAAMEKDITVTYWLDPNDVDSPGTGKTLPLRAALGANRYRGFPEGGSTCQRMLLEIKAKASTNGGVIRGLKITADTAPGMLPSNSQGGV